MSNISSRLQFVWKVSTVKADHSGAIFAEVPIRALINGSHLFFRDDCFVVMLQYLNEISFHYICAGSAEAAQVKTVSLLYFSCLLSLTYLSSPTLQFTHKHFSLLFPFPSLYFSSASCTYSYRNGCAKWDNVFRRDHMSQYSRFDPSTFLWETASSHVSHMPRCTVRFL